MVRDQGAQIACVLVIRWGRRGRTYACPEYFYPAKQSTPLVFISEAGL